MFYCGYTCILILFIMEHLIYDKPAYVGASKALLFMYLYSSIKSYSMFINEYICIIVKAK